MHPLLFFLLDCFPERGEEPAIGCYSQRYRDDDGGCGDDGEVTVWQSWRTSTKMEDGAGDDIILKENRAQYRACCIKYGEGGRERERERKRFNYV